MHLEELALVPGGDGGLVRAHGVFVHRQREVGEVEGDLVLVLGVLEDLVDELRTAGAVGAVEVRALDDGQLGALELALAGQGVGGDLAALLVSDRRRLDLGQPVLRHLVVEIGRLDLVLGHVGLGLGHLLVDHGLEGLEGLGARERTTVDEEGRGPARAELHGDLLVALDHRGDLGALAIRVELLDVEAELGREGNVGLLVQGPALGLLEQGVVHLPELALLVRGEGGAGSGLGLLVHRERLLAEHHADLVAVLLLDLREGREHAAAVGALEVRVLDDGHERLVEALLRAILRGHGVVLGRVGLAGASATLLLVLALGARRSGALGLGRAHDPGVDLFGLGAGVDQGLGEGLLLLDELLELIDVLGAALGQTVDEEARGRAHAELLALGRLRVDLRRVGVGLELLLELGHVGHASFFGVLDQVLVGEGAGVLEREVMHRPADVLALRVGGEHGLRGRLGPGVHREREVLEDDADVLGVGLAELAERVGQAATIGALDVRVLDDGHERGLLGAVPHVGVLVGDLVAIPGDLVVERVVDIVHRDELAAASRGRLLLPGGGDASGGGREGAETEQEPGAKERVNCETLHDVFLGRGRGPAGD